jgi:hypothetical protein
MVLILEGWDSLSEPGKASRAEMLLILVLAYKIGKQVLFLVQLKRGFKDNFYRFINVLVKDATETQNPVIQLPASKCPSYTHECMGNNSSVFFPSTSLICKTQSQAPVY